jgi:putative glycosyltransferase (TIGR04372 family)
MKWFKSQIRQLKNANSKILKYKINKLILYFLIFNLVLIFFPLFLIVRFLSGFILIRFANLDSTRIGHFANDVNVYLGTVEKNIKFQYDFFYVEKPVCNNALLKIFKRQINVVPEFLIRPFMLLNRIKFLGSSKHIIEVNPFLDLYDSRDRDEILRNTGKTVLKQADDMRDRDIKSEKKINYFNQKDIEYGHSFLKDLGLSKDDKFVCLLCRDDAYTKSIFQDNFSLEYETEGDKSTFRNADIENFKLVSEYLTELGYYVIRMGDKNSKPFLTNNKKIIDYTKLEKKNEFMDIFLASHCNFFITTLSGLDAMASIHNIPFVIVNFPQVSLTRSTNKKQITIFKHFKRKKDSKNLTLSEIFDLNLAGALTNDIFSEKQIELIENTPEEIKDAVIEMIELIKNNFIVSDKNKDLQSVFWNLYFKKIDEYDLHFQHADFVKAHIGFSFLEKNKNFLK